MRRTNSKEVKNEPQNIDKLTEKETLLSNETIEKLCNRGEKYKELLTIIDNTISIEVSQEKVKKKTFFETSLNPKFKNDKLNKIFKDFINNSVNKFSLTKNEKFKISKNSFNYDNKPFSFNRCKRNFSSNRFNRYFNWK